MPAFVFDPDLRRLAMASVIAIGVHVALIGGVHFTAPTIVPQTMIEVTLALHHSTKADEKADFLAAAHQQGSGQLTQALEMTTTESADFTDAQIHDIKPEEQLAFSPPPDPVEHRLIVSHHTSTYRLPPMRHKPKQPPEITGEGELMMSAQTSAIASLEARLAAKRQALAKQGRIHTVSTLSARQDLTASYIDQFRQKVEKMGNAHYPSAARQRHLQGEVRLLVSISSGGSVKDIQILSSSGYTLLDEAARRSVQLAQPFAPFTREMRQKWDVLQIIRTWRFTESMTNEN